MGKGEGRGGGEGGGEGRWGRGRGGEGGKGEGDDDSLDTMLLLGRAVDMYMYGHGTSHTLCTKRYNN